MKQLKVNECFLSIQGESTFAGLPCVFLRLSGCPLNCTWCDTEYAKEEGDYLPFDHIFKKLLSFGIDLIEVTGGEPLAQEATFGLLRKLCDQGFKVLLETSGALDISRVDPRVHVIMDIKCPGSGMAGRMHWPNLQSLLPHHEVKFVCQDRKDYEFARDIIKNNDLSNKVTVLFSAVTGKLDPKVLVNWVLEDRLPARFQLQMHKYIWPPEQRGV
jgi:7-carboxy-7-deazaguanine synthase